MEAYDRCTEVSDDHVRGLDVESGGSSPARHGEKGFDVFLSHSTRDAATVQRIARALLQDGITPWLDAWCLTPGESWQEGLDRGLRQSASCAVFVGPDDLGPWERLEVER